MLSLIALAALAEEPTHFAEPLPLYADGVLMNGIEKMPYPSPVLFDIDRDGNDELVLGDLWGYMHVHENLAEEGDPVWGPSKKLEDEDGKVIKVSNW